MELFNITFEIFIRTLGPFKKDMAQDLRELILNTPNGTLPTSIQAWKQELDMYLEN